jgi:sugar phosphate isomerase/epimerase
MKLGFTDQVVRDAYNIAIGDQTVGVAIDVAINYYRGMPASAVEKLEVAIDGETVPQHLILFNLNGKNVPLDRVPGLFEEYWGIKEAARLLIFNGGLSEGQHRIDVTLELRNVYMRFGPGLYGGVDSSGSKTVTIGPAREYIGYHGPFTPGRSANGIEEAISTYCFTERFVKDPAYGIEQVFADIASFGVAKIELVGAQAFRNYPTPSDAEIAEVLAAADKYGIEIYSYGGYIDVGRVTGHDMTDDEQINEVIMDMMTAKKLGATILRTPFTPGNIERIARLAQTYGLIVGCEVHAPEAPRSPHTLALIEALDKLRATDPEVAKHVGLVPDFGCFIERPNKISYDRFAGLGAKPELLDYIIANRWSGLDEHEMTDKVTEMGGGEAEKMAVSEWFGYMSFGPADLEGFKAMLPYCVYFHGKYYHIEEDCVETTIPYDALLGMIADSGFQGVILTEYEGHAFYLNDAVEQVGRHLEMKRRLLSAHGQ